MTSPSQGKYPYSTDYKSYLSNSGNKMKNRSVFTLILIFLLASSTFAQSEQPKKKSFEFSEKQVGIAAGFSTAFGLSYRQYFDRYGFQVSFAPIKSEDFSLYSLGATFLYRIKDADNVNFFLYQGNHFAYSEDEYFTYNSQSGQYSSYLNIDRNLINSVGFGIEMLMGDYVTANLMTGYAAYEIFDRVNLTVEIGFYYRFKSN